MENIFYKIFFEQSPVSEVMMDTDFRIVAATNLFLKNTKTTFENIVGKNIFIAFPQNPADRNTDGENNIRQSLTRVLQTKLSDKITVVKYDILKPDNEGGGYEVKYWRVQHSPIFDELKNVQFIVQLGEDVTENEILVEKSALDKKLLQQLEDGKKRFSMMLMKSPFAFAIFKGEDMIITVANDSIKKLWRKGEDVEGKPLFNILPELQVTPFADLIKQVYTSGIPFQENELFTRFMREDKLEEGYFNFIYQPYLEVDKTISGVTVIAYEVTPQVHLKKALAAQLVSEQKANIRIEEVNKRYYNMFMESPFAFSIMKGEDMVIILANDLMKTFWGKGKNVEGQTLLNLLPEWENQIFPEIINSVYTTGTAVYLDEFFTLIKNNGIVEEQYFNIVYQPHYESDQTISGVTTIAYKVTEMVLARKNIQESEIHFRHLADMMPSKISNTDVDGKLIYVNQKWLEYAGLTFEELKDYKYHSIIHPSDVEEFKKRFLYASETGTVLKMDMRFLNKAGKYKWHINLASPIKDKNGKITLWVGSTTEIHEQVKQKEKLEIAVKKRTEELVFANHVLNIQNLENKHRTAELGFANDELAFQSEEIEKRSTELISANKELHSFTYVASHDLQEPLRKIQTFASRILETEDGNLSEAGKDYFRRMQNSVARMQQLIDDLLAFSRTNTSERNLELINLNVIMEEVKADLKDSIENNHVIIEIKDMCMVSVIVFQFRQLMFNLISNAIKFASPDKTPHVIINSRIIKGHELKNENVLPEKKYCHISVIDNGIGFDSQYSHRIFEVFQRLHSKETYKGTGIGLAIVKKIVDNHFGIITASSKLGEGATFDVYLPIY